MHAHLSDNKVNSFVGDVYGIYNSEYFFFYVVIDHLFVLYSSLCSLLPLLAGCIPENGMCCIMVLL